MDTLETTTTEPNGEVKKRRQFNFDASARTLTLVEPDGASTTYPLHKFPQNTGDYICQVGLSVLLGRSDNPDSTFDALVDGKLPQRGGGGRRPGPWRQAIASAFIDAAKKSGSSLAPDEAAKRAAALTKEQAEELKLDGAVVRHWRKLTGRDAVTAASLLAA